MIRYLIGLLITFIALTFIRAVMGIISKAVTDEVKSSVVGDGAQPARASGEKTKHMLRKCAVCGTFKPEDGMIAVREGAQTSLYCSRECQKQAVS